MKYVLCSTVLWLVLNCENSICPTPSEFVQQKLNTISRDGLFSWNYSKSFLMNMRDGGGGRDGGYDNGRMLMMMCQCHYCLAE